MSIFITGFPGFIARNLLKKMAEQSPAEKFELLVQPSLVEKARSEIAQQERGPGPKGRFSLIPGDITREGFGLDRQALESLSSEATKVFHLAAVYDLAVPRHHAYNVNVKGTLHVNQFVQRIRGLERYVYFSTAYVSGKRTGRILETELDLGQEFKNDYEATKFEAEKLVQEIKGGVPTTIIRPAVVVGDSRTGETFKFDGIYFTMRFLEKFRYLPLPYIGKGDVRLNAVPIDYIVNAALFLSGSRAGENKVYHLADPHPLRARDVYALICRELLGKAPSWTIPASVISAALSIPWFRRWVGVEKETIDYLSCAAEYDASQAVADLQGSGIRCPDIREYLPRCIAFYKEHRNDPEKRIMVH